MSRVEKKIIQPDYYDEFLCIADKCPFTCCRDWKIAVDKLTKNKWEKLLIPSDMKNLKSAKDKSYLKDYVRYNWGGDEVCLEGNGRCPFLTAQGFCHIVSEYGEENISNTCHTFPREEHEHSSRTERTLTMGCPAALDLLWEKDSFELNEIKTDDGMLFQVRDKFVDVIRDKSISIEIGIKSIFYIMLEYYEKDVYEQEAFDEVISAISQIPVEKIDSYSEQNELFLDLAENYRKRGIYADVIEPLAEKAELFAEDYMSMISLREKFEEEWDKWNNQMRLLMCEEVYSTLLISNGNQYTMTLKLQWLGITYAVIKQVSFLKWCVDGKLDYESIKTVVTVIIRMTGYSEDDIEEYLDNCFEEIIWDWGYMALIMG